jgi:hypothetical protein
MLGKLLDISRFESGAVETDIQSFRLDDMLGKLVAEFQPTADRKGLRLTVVPTGLLVRSDPRHLRRIVQNYLANAIAYTASGRVLIGGRPIPAVLVTADHTDHVRNAAAAIDVQLLYKPVRSDDLANAIRPALQRSEGEAAPGTLAG